MTMPAAMPAATNGAASSTGGGLSGVGARLRAVRKQKHMTLQDVEQASDGEFKASVLGAYERDQRRIAVSRLQRLAQIYRVPLEQLLPPSAAKGGDIAAPTHSRRNDVASIDLTKMDRVQGPERDVLRRCLQSIEVQRQDFNGRVLTIRRDDIRIIAALFQRTPAAMVARLDELGLLINKP
jgi:transcriptional regulator with XRE-family HTH domain